MLLPLLSKNIMDKGFIAGDYNELVKLVLITMVLYVFTASVDSLKEKKRIDIETKLKYRLTEQSFKHLINLKIQYFNNSNYTEVFEEYVRFDYLELVSMKRRFLLGSKIG